MNLKPNIRDRVKEVCRERGVSLNTLEQACGFSAGAISHWDTKIPSVDRVVRVADYFDISMDTLLGRRPSQTNHTGIDGAYLSLARTAAKSGIKPTDIEIMMDAVQKMRSRA